jgi:peroxiredoxin
VGKELDRAHSRQQVPPLIGKQAPVFTQNDVSGKPVSLAGLKGKLRIG